MGSAKTRLHVCTQIHAEDILDRHRNQRRNRRLQIRERTQNENGGGKEELRTAAEGVGREPEPGRHA